MRGADNDSLEHLRNTVADFHENLLHCFVLRGCLRGDAQANGARCDGVLIQTERAECDARFVDLILNLVCHRRSLFVHLVVSRLTSVGGSMKSRVYPLTLVRVVRTT